MTKKTKLKHNQSGFSTVEVVLVIVIIVLVGAVGYLVYKNHHKTSTADITTTSSTKHVTPTSTKTATVTPVQPVNPTTGWKSYTLPQEKLSFKYPSSWSLVTYADSPTQGDAVNLTGSNNATLTIDVGAGNAGFSCPYGGCNILNADPVTFVGQKAYFDSFSGNGSNPVSETELSMSASSISFFPAKNVVAPAEDQSTATIAIGFNYRGSSQQNSNPQTLSYILADQNYQDAKLVIESMSY